MLKMEKKSPYEKPSNINRCPSENRKNFVYYTKQQHTYTHTDNKRISKGQRNLPLFILLLLSPLASALLFLSAYFKYNLLKIIWCNGKFYNELKYNSLGSFLLPLSSLSLSPTFNFFFILLSCNITEKKAPNNKWEKCFLINKVFKLRKLTWRPQDFSQIFLFKSMTSLFVIHANLTNSLSMLLTTIITFHETFNPTKA